jgi:alkaline phosphatase
MIRLKCRYSVLFFALSIILISISLPTYAARNVILMIGDGMGPEQVKAGRILRSGPRGMLTMEGLPYGSVMSTTPGNYPITDSAASGTAMACGHTTNLERIGTLPDGQRVANIVELARDAGLLCGLVTNTPMSHATPASFGAHDSERSRYQDIARDYIHDTSPHLLLGGGFSQEYFPQDAIDDATRAGYRLVTDATQLGNIDMAAQERVLGLFTPELMSYEVDRDPESGEPSLSEMVQAALAFMQQATPGFFMMIEGGLIDYACHNNDIYRTVYEVEEFDKAVELVLDWWNANQDTLLIVTADHECGGLTVLPGNYHAGDVVDAVWSSTWHTAVDVPVFAKGPGAESIPAHIMNTDIAGIMAGALGLNYPPPPAAMLVRTPDYDADNKVDARDFLRFRSAWMNRLADEEYEIPGFGTTIYSTVGISMDLNWDMKLDYLDLMLLTGSADSLSAN